jgi:hypothetical protein
MRAGLLAAVASFGPGCDGEHAIGPEGGTLASDDGRFSLEIPAGALDTEMEFSVEEVSCDLEAAIGSCYAALPIGTTFRLPVLVAFDVADLSVDKPVAVVAASDEGWRALPDQDADKEDGFVYGSAMYLSEYGLTPAH